MKIAFAVSGDDMSSPIDERFGRAPNFLVYDTSSKNFEIVPNSAIDAGHGAGLKAAETVIRAGAEAIVAGELGPKASDMLAKAGLTYHSATSMSVAQALALHFPDAQ